MQMSGLCTAVADLRPRSAKLSSSLPSIVAVLIGQRGEEEEDEEEEGGKEENESKKENFLAYSSVRFAPHPLAAAQVSLVW